MAQNYHLRQHTVSVKQKPMKIIAAIIKARSVLPKTVTTYILFQNLQDNLITTPHTSSNPAGLGDWIHDHSAWN